MSDSNLTKVLLVSSDAYASGTLLLMNMNAPLCMNALNDFKQAMVEYYKTALSNYDCENPHTSKSACLKCNKSRSLAQPVS